MKEILIYLPVIFHLKKFEKYFERLRMRKVLVIVIKLEQPIFVPLRFVKY